MKETVTIKVTKEAREHLRVATALADKQQLEVSEQAFKSERDRQELRKRESEEQSQ